MGGVDPAQFVGPGLYIPGRMAVVISETVAATANGAERLMDFPPHLFVV
jgi:Xaa-Pro aminopeptidase